MGKLEIKSTAMVIFSKKGYHDTSIQDIADSLGINKATIYVHFKSKSDLYTEILDDIIPLFVNEIKRVIENVLDRPLESVMKAVFYVFINSLSFHQLLLWKRTLLMSTSDFDQEIQQSARMLIKKRDEQLTKVFSETILAKRPEIGQEEMSLFMVSYFAFIRSFVDWMLLNNIGSQPVDVLTMAEKLWLKFWNGSRIE